MPVPLRAFYTDYRNSGCINDVMDIQHKMSRNPNLWAILDADLVCRGGEKRLRCSYCHQPGHKRENCPDKRKPATCHMCGGGHLESRCPQRIAERNTHVTARPANTAVNSSAPSAKAWAT
ncbi:hypothetical protein G9C98_008349 [Cotesia typhae]|uniref:CCHC-type domain-containing protein n=1 Tax=Cotesia typhae TaxID=2053667 RepID=A0A8J5QJ04_9HYME|nr:hypothetical protein G9C98_008349 [Cotesia typhae]